MSAQQILPTITDKYKGKAVLIDFWNTWGTGVGGGIIVDGHVVAGYNGAGGEIGHITVNHDEIEPCNCGQYGW